MHDTHVPQYLKMLSIKSVMHAWWKYIKDQSDEERTDNQGYMTQLATHALIMTNNQLNDILVDLTQFTKTK